MVKRKKVAPLLPDGGTKGCAPDDEKRGSDIAPPTTPAKPRFTLQEAVAAQNGVTVLAGRSDPDADGMSCGGAGVGIVMINLPYWRTQFGKTSEGPLNTLISTLIALTGCVIGRTAADEAGKEETLDRLRAYIALWAGDGFKEPAGLLANFQPQASGAFAGPTMTMTDIDMVFVFEVADDFLPADHADYMRGWFWSFGDDHYPVFGPFSSREHAQQHAALLASPRLMGCGGEFAAT